MTMDRGRSVVSDVEKKPRHEYMKRRKKRNARKKEICTQIRFDMCECRYIWLRSRENSIILD